MRMFTLPFLTSSSSSSRYLRKNIFLLLHPHTLSPILHIGLDQDFNSINLKPAWLKSYCFVSFSSVFVFTFTLLSDCSLCVMICNVMNKSEERSSIVEKNKLQMLVMYNIKHDLYHFHHYCRSLHCRFYNWWYPVLHSLFNVSLLFPLHFLFQTFPLPFSFLLSSSSFFPISRSVISSSSIPSLHNLSSTFTGNEIIDCLLFAASTIVLRYFKSPSTSSSCSVYVRYMKKWPTWWCWVARKTWRKFVHIHPVFQD